MLHSGGLLYIPAGHPHQAGSAHEDPNPHPKPDPNLNPNPNPNPNPNQALNRRYLAAFDQLFAPLLRSTRGNGEDLTYSHFARLAGGARRAIGTCDNEGHLRDACAVATGEFAYLTGAINPQDGLTPNP